MLLCVRSCHRAARGVQMEDVQARQDNAIRKSKKCQIILVGEP